MKKFKISIILSIFPAYIFAQDTLQHFNFNTTIPIVESYPSNQGFFSGHNSYGDEEFAEKYEFIGTTNVLGVIAIHQGSAGTSSMNSSYKIYDVGANGLPNTELASKTVANNSIPVDGTHKIVMFNSPVPISNDFFVSFNLGDYIHNSPGTKTIAVSHSPNGSRPSSDFSVFGRNVIRWHNGNHNGVSLWKDYRTENFPGYQPAIYFSLFPIVEMNSTSVVTFNNKNSNIGSIYPNPSKSGEFNIPITSRNGGNINIKLLDLEGKVILKEQATIKAGKTNHSFYVNNLNKNMYILLIESNEGAVAQQVYVN